MRQIVKTNRAPAAIGPYSQGIVAAGSFVFSAGQIPIDLATGELAVGDVAAQTHQALKNLSAVLEAAGSSLKQVVKTTVFLQNMGDFAAVNEVYSQYFSIHPPARSTIEVAKLPKGALVEIEAIALVE